MNTPSIRQLSCTGALLCYGLLIAGLFLQAQWHLTPCPLCVIQRVLFALSGLGFTCLALYPPKLFYRKFICFVLLWLSIIGASTALHQIHIQKTPADPHAQSCGAEITYLLQNLPLKEATTAIFQGLGDCRDDETKILGWGIPHWSMACFFLLAMLALGGMVVKE